MGDQHIGDDIWLSFDMQPWVAVESFAASLMKQYGAARGGKVERIELVIGYNPETHSISGRVTY
jgi:hypothetical protein